jgi:hypothetical protein
MNPSDTKQKMLSGDVLIATGHVPGHWSRPALQQANAEGLSGDELRAILDSFVRAATQRRVALDRPAPCSMNILDENAAEVANVASITATMDVPIRTPTVVAGAVMPGACPSGPPGTILVGGVVVTRNAIHPGFHSADICCSVMLTEFAAAEPKAILDVVHTVTHFGPGGCPTADSFEAPAETDAELGANAFLSAPELRAAESAHLGTKGDGNLFAFVRRSAATGRTCLATHHGSRGPGAAQHADGMQGAERPCGEQAPAVLLIRRKRTPINLGFAPHRARRNLSRGADRRAQGNHVPEAVFARETAGIDARYFCVGIDASELPSVGKPAASLREQMARFGLAEVVEGIEPYGSIMAGDWQPDAPWRRARKSRGKAA